MGLRCAEVRMGSLASYKYGVESYDSAKLGLGTLMAQKTGAAETDKFCGPMPIARLRLFEEASSNSHSFPWVMQWSATEDWLFLADLNSAAVTRRLAFVKFNRSTGVFAWQGFVTLTLPPNSGNATSRGLRMTYDKHTAGTVAVSGTTVTGTGTRVVTDRVAVGSRIGFGSTDPTQITTWYEIASITSDTNFALDTTPGTISAGTPYVIEELRAVYLTTNATAANGGLFVAKGLRPELFTPAGTAIGGAASTDNVRAVYHLRDASPNTITAGAGLAIDERVDFTSHTVWVLNGTTTMQLFKMNLRAALSPTSGEAQDAFVLKTAVSATLTGTGSQANNGRIATAGHGPGSGVKCIYWTTTTRIYRTKDVSTIVSNDSAFIADTMLEVPPGGTTTFAASNLMNSIEYSSVIDRFVVALNATGADRHYLTRYAADGSQMDRVLSANLKQTDQSTASAELTPTPFTQNQAASVWIEGGLMYFISAAPTAATTGILWAVPIAADWDFGVSADSRIVSPKISLPDCDEVQRVVVGNAEVLGGNSLGNPPEPVRLYYRTSGINDDSGAWTALDQSGTMPDGVTATEIQIAMEFRVAGPIMVPARVFAVDVVYTDTATDSHYQPSIGKSDLANKRFAWRHSVAFGASVPALRVRLYDAVTGGLLLDDNTGAAGFGTFERSTDGSSWVAWTNADKANETTWIRYTPTSFADNVKVRALLTQL